MIPGGQCATMPATGVPVDRYCGNNLYCLNTVPATTLMGAATDATVCSNQKPFKISVESDGVEYMFPATTGEGFTGNNIGFEIGNFALITWSIRIDRFSLSGYFMKTDCLTRPAQ